MSDNAPVRMCAACRRRFPKARLLRHTLSPQGDWMPDADQKRAGRGWYVCADPVCRERFVRGKASGRKNKGASSARRRG